MATRDIRLLHVEDDPVQQQLLAHHLKALREFRFTITAVTTEDDALQAAGKDRFEFFVIDYNLPQGDGLHLIQRIRSSDPIVPIIAVSGVASPETASELVRAGADDFLNKRDLSTSLAGSFRAALLRADAVRTRAASAGQAGPNHLGQRLRELCQLYAAAVGGEIVRRLDEVEDGARNAHLSAAQLEALVAEACAALAQERALDMSAATRLVRPLLLELAARLFTARKR